MQPYAEQHVNVVFLPRVTFDPSSSSSSASGGAVVEPNAGLGAVVREKEVWVALATPRERRRRDGLQTEGDR